MRGAYYSMRCACGTGAERRIGVRFSPALLALALRAFHELLEARDQPRRVCFEPRAAPRSIDAGLEQLDDVARVLHSRRLELEVDQRLNGRHGNVVGCRGDRDVAERGIVRLCREPD